MPANVKNILLFIVYSAKKNYFCALYEKEASYASISYSLTKRKLIK